MKKWPKTKIKGDCMDDCKSPLNVTNPEKIIKDFILKCKLLKIEEQAQKEIRVMTGRHLSQFNKVDKSNK